MIQKEALFQIGYFAKPHGIKGELSLHTDYAEIMDGLKDSCLVCEMDGLPVPFFVEAFRPKSRSVVLIKLENVNDEPAARKFANKKAFCLVEAIKNKLAACHNRNIFTGYMLKDVTEGEVGIVTEVDESTINTLFKIDYKGKELLVPVAEELIRVVDHDNRCIIVSLPEGLIDL